MTVMEKPTNLVTICSAEDFQDKDSLLNEVMRVEAEAWPKEIRASKDKFVSRLELFPQGFFVVEMDGKIGGVSTSERIDFSPPNPPTSWEGVTDNGYIKASHKPDGNSIYVVSVGVSDWAQGKGLGTELVKAQVELTKKFGLEYLVLGARLPGYRDYHTSHPNVSAQEYLDLKNNKGEPFDREIRFYTRNGLKPQHLTLNYMEDDTESENYGVVMIWENTKSE